jgi:WD40 repeat protein
MDLPNPRPNPFVGPRAFQTGEALYGRDRETRQLVDLLIAERIVMLHSPSGAGKTSLIRAGLIPRLQKQGFAIQPVVRVNQSLPPGLEGSQANRYVYSAILSLEEEGRLGEREYSQEELSQMRLRDYLNLRSESRVALPEDGGFALREDMLQDEVLIFDQFEEILTTGPTDQAGKEAFFEQLGEALRDRQRWALFSIREDYLAALAPYLRPIPTRFHTTFRLDLLGVAAALQAVQAPPRTQGVTFVESAAMRLVNDLRKVQVQRPDGSTEEHLGPYVEPVQLQVVCYRLWQHLPADDLSITEEDLEKIGDVNESLAAYYSDSVKAVSAESSASERMIREWFQNELITEQGIRSQVIMGKEISGGLPNDVIRRLEDTHLVRAEKRRGLLWFELAHDRLVEPVYNSNAAWFRDNLSLLQRQAAMWHNDNRPERLLLRGQALQEAETWAEENPAELTHIDTDFLAASRKERQRELEERERQEQAVKLQEQARLANKLRQRLVLASIAAVVALMFFAAAAYFGFLATQQRLLAQSNAVTAQAASTQAVANAITAEANAQLAQAASTQASIERAAALAASTQAVAGQSTAVAALATSDYNAQVAQQKSIEALEQARLAQSRQLASQAQSYLSTRPELAALLAVEADNATRTTESLSALLHTIQRGLSETLVDQSNVLPANNNAVHSVALSPDGKYMAWGLSEGTVLIWDLQTSQVVDSRKIHADKVFSLEFTPPDSRYLVSGGNLGVTIFHDLQTGELIEMETHTTSPVPVFGFSFSPDGARLAITRASDVFVYDVTDPRNVPEPQRLSGGHLSTVIAVDWGPGNWLASGDRSGSVLVWDTQTGSVVRSLSRPTDAVRHTFEVNAVSWSPDGARLATAGNDGQVIVWDVNTGAAITALKGQGFDFFYAVSFSADGRFLAGGTGNGDILIWKQEDYSLFASLNTFDQPVLDLRFSPLSGVNLLASGSQAGTLGLQRINTRDPLSEQVLEQPAHGDLIALGQEPGGSLLGAAAAPNGVDILELDGAALNFRVNITGAYTSAAFSPDGKTLLLGGQDGSLLLVDTISGGRAAAPGSLFSAPRSLFSAPVTALAFHPDGRTVAAGTGESQAAQSDASSDGLGQVLLVDLQSGELLGEPIESRAMVTALAFTGNGLRLLIGREDGLVVTWEMDAGEYSGVPLERHVGAVTALAVGPQGDLATGSLDRTLGLWDLDSAQAIGPPLLGANLPFLSLAYDETGTVLYSGSSGGGLLRWDVDPQGWVERVCQQAGRNLTADEWAQFMPAGEPYRQTCPQFP